MSDEKLDIARVISSQSYATKLRFPNQEREDMEQEAWVWVLEHQPKIKDYMDQENAALAAYALGQDIWKVMDRYARREKAAAGGYQVEDELFYSDAVINVVLPSVLKGDTDPPVRDGERVANTSDPAEGGTWMATYMDVSRAWDAADLTGPQRDLMVLYYRDEYTQQEAADHLGVSQPTITKRLKAARRKLIDELGGRKPRDDDEYRQRPGAHHVDDGIKAAAR